jgi:hypothetical protein
LDQLAATNGGQGFGIGAGQIFVESYYSLAGRSYDVNGMVNVRLEGHTPTSLTELHSYPVEWYSESASSGFSNGLKWNSQNWPDRSAYYQDWHDRDANGNPVEVPDREFDLKVTSGAKDFLVARDPEVVLYNREGTVAGSTPLAKLTFTENSPAFADMTIVLAEDDVALSFAYQFHIVGDGDQLGVWIDEELRFVVTGEVAGLGLYRDMVSLEGLSPGIHYVTVALHSFGESGASFSFGELSIVSVPEPASLLLLCGSTLLLNRRRW